MVRISEVATDGAILGVDVIDGGSGYFGTVSFTMYSEEGQGADLLAVVGSDGSISLSMWSGRKGLQIA